MAKSKTQPTTEKKTEPELKAFRVLHGLHSEGYSETGSPRIYRKGDIVVTENDLLKHNSRGSVKFERTDVPSSVSPAVDKTETVVPVEDNLSEMTVEELKAYAEAEEIDLGNATLKKDILAVIRYSDNQ